jgi:uncharacterized protein YbjT (DUF2867 family)
VDELRAAGRDAVRLDLDDPSTFAHALHGVDRVYLLTGYTVAMLTQSKTLVDAAVKAGVFLLCSSATVANLDCDMLSTRYPAFRSVSFINPFTNQA